MSPSTQNLTGFLDPPHLQRVCKACAALDAALEPEDWLRYHAYYPDWAEGLEVAKVDNGGGDRLFCLFSALGTVVIGFDHESALSPHAQEEYQVWPGLYDGLPPILSALLDDPAFEREDVTFCLWRLAEDSAWRTGPVQIPPGEDDGSSFLLGTLFPTPEEYLDWARDYYDAALPPEEVARVYASY